MTPLPLFSTPVCYYAGRKHVEGILMLYQDELVFTSTTSHSQSALNLSSSSSSLRAPFSLRLPLNEIYGCHMSPELVGDAACFPLWRSRSKMQLPAYPELQENPKDTHASYIALPLGQSGDLKGSKHTLSQLRQFPMYLQSSQASLVHSASTNFTIFTMRLGQRPLRQQPMHRSYTFGTSTQTKTAEGQSSVAWQWVDRLQKLVVPLTSKGEQRRLLVLVNPWGGRKKAVQIYEKYAAPLFHIAGLKVTIVHTERKMHAYEIAKELDLDSFDMAVTVSGDGLFHEFINGLMDRTDGDRIRAFPVGIIPAGSGNALAKSIDTIYPDVAALNIIKGGTRPFDLYALTQFKGDRVTKRMFGFLEIMWALIADVDIESEGMRWAGSARFTLTAIQRVIRLRKYYGTLRYLPAGLAPPSARPRFQDCTPSNVPKEWVTVTSEFAYFMAMNTAWCAHDFLVTPNSRLADGALDLVWIEEGSLRRMLRVLLDTESGTYVKESFVREEKVRAFLLEPNLGQPFGVLDVDGEVVPYSPILVEVLHQAATLLVPVEHDESRW